MPAVAAAGCTTQQFWDVSISSSFCSQIQWLASTGITTGYTDPGRGKPGFHPAAAVSRQAMAAFLHRYGYTSQADPPCAGPFRIFRDVGPGAFCGVVEWLSGAGISTGYADHRFHPQEAVSRQAMAAFLYRFRDPGGTAPACTTQQFWDVPVSNPFCPQIKWLASAGLTEGYSDPGKSLPGFHPTEAVSRQAMAAFLYRAQAGNVIKLNSAKPLPTVTSVSPASGTASGDTTVTITGTNLTGVTRVYFDLPDAEVPAGGHALKVLSATSLTIGTPPHYLGRVSVRVKSATGMSVPGAATFTYTSSGMTGISGRLTATGGSPVAGGGVSAYNSLGNGFGVGTEVDGSYLVSGLAAGTYRVCFDGPTSPNDPGYVEQCRGDVKVAAGVVTSGIDATIIRAGGIRGKVTAGGAAMANVSVLVYRPDGVGVTDTVTAANGTYRIPMLEPGSYRVCFGPGDENGRPSSYAPQCFSGKSVDDVPGSTPVNAVAGSFTSGVDAALVKAR